MTSTTSHHRGRDLDSDREVEEFVRRFYENIGPENRVHPYLVRANVDLPTHEVKLTEFWLGLLGEGAAPDADVVIEAHRHMHDEAPLDRQVFESWLDVLDNTLDQGWSGPRTETLRKRSYGLARAMAARFIDSPLRNPPGYVPPRRVRDLSNRDDIDRFVTHFYRDVSMDELLHEHFDSAKFDWQAHMLTLGDYWHGVLFSRDHDEGEAIIESHRHLDAKIPFTEAMFTRWIELFNSALNHDWAGPNVEHLRRHGHGMAWAMARRYAGITLQRPVRE